MEFYSPNGRVNYLIISNNSAPMGKFWHNGTPSNSAEQLRRQNAISPANNSASRTPNNSANGPTNGPASGWKSKSQRINDIRDLYLLVHQIGTAAFVDDSYGLVVHGNHA